MLVFGVASIFGFGDDIAFSNNPKYITMTFANMGNMLNNNTNKTKMHNNKFYCVGQSYIQDIDYIVPY